MGKKPAGTPYVEYYISMHLSYCRGPVDAWRGMKAKDKHVFEDNFNHFTSTKESVNRPDLYGGHLREGGLVGDIYFMNGGGDQESPEALAKRCGRPVNRMPGFRGIVSFFFCGNDDTGAKGFAVGCNNPQVPNFEVRLQRKSEQLDNNHKVIVYEDNQGRNWHDSNPANIIYECLVHKDLMNGKPSMIDEDSFKYAADWLNDEKFGISLMWTATSPIEDFIQEVLNHINGLLFFNPFTGKLVLKLLRKDYDRDELGQIGPDTCTVKTFRRPLWGETTNEIVLNYTNPTNEEQESITFQDLANIAMQGEVVSETRDLRGIRNKPLATDVCARELRLAATPLATADIVINRQDINPMTGRPYVPGDVFILNYPLYGAAQVIFRLMEVDWGSVEDSKVTFNCIEDVFGFPYAVWTPPPDTEWEPPEEPDSPIYEEIEYLFRATPLPLIHRRAPQIGNDPFSVEDDKWPTIAINTYVLPTDEQFDLQYYEPYRPGVNTLGEPVWTSLGEKRTQGHTKLVETIGQAIRSNITMEPYIGPGDWPKVGWLGMFLGEDEFTDELFVFEEKLEPDEDGNPRWRIRRGVIDTIPAEEWPTGTRIIIHANNYNGYDWSGRFAFEDERYRFQFKMSTGDTALTEEVTTNRVDRPYMPFRPADCKIAGVRFGTSDQRQMIDPEGEYNIFELEHVPREWEIDFTWARRNRFSEDLTWLAWNDADVPPEDGQTTEIIIMLGKTEIDRVVGLTGTSYTLKLMEKTFQYTDMNFKFISRRPHPDYPDGITSLQGMVINLKLYMKGYGSDWDYYWGGWPRGAILTSIDDFDVEGLLPTASVEVEN